MSDLWSLALGEEGKLLESLTMSGLSVYNEPPTGACIPQPSQPLNPSASCVYALKEGRTSVRYYITRIQQLQLYRHVLGQAARDVNYSILEKRENLTSPQGTGELQQRIDFQIKKSKVNIIKQKNDFKLKTKETFGQL